MNSQQLVQLLVCLGLLLVVAVGGVATHDTQTVTESVETQDTATFLSETPAQTADNRSEGDTGAQAADIRIQSTSAPDTIPVDGSLTVDYTLENVGNTNGTESFVDLLVDGTDSTFDDTDTNVTVPAGGATSGTLVFDNVSGFFAPGDTVNFTVELFDFGDVASGTTDVGTPDIRIQSISAVGVVPADGNLTVDYTLENAGNTNGTESFVDLLVDGTDSTFDDTDTNVTVPADGTTSGTLVFDNVSGFFAPGDTVNFTVELFDFGDVASGDTAVYEPAPEYSVGDVDRDDDVDIVDAVLIQQHLAQLNPEPFDPNLADVDRTGDLSIVDAVLVQRKLARLDDPGITNVTTVDAPGTVTVGAQLNVSATITNDGGLGTVQTAEFRFAENESDLDANATVSATTVDLGGGETERPTATIDTTQLDPGTHHIAVVTDDDSRRLTVDVVNT